MNYFLLESILNLYLEPDKYKRAFVIWKIYFSRILRTLLSSMLLLYIIKLININN